ncbi:hypothetical protein CTI14_72345, partial [Methylobacterium radiotolerans]
AALYENGQGVKRQQAEAFRLYRQAGEGGNVVALNLAALYENGQGVKRQQAEAFRLYRQAGEGGNVVAL